MARGVSSPAASAPLPKVSFVKIQDDGSTQPAGVHDLQARSYGYNDFSDFRRPEYYIRHIEPLESELAIQVEYDMDEQDQEWLDAVNAERKKEQLNAVSYETFEIIMDRLEKEWFDLTKNIPKPDYALPSEDSTCAICDDSEGENSNAIVFCDGCNLAVHQDCYGVPYIPEGQWLCRKCTVSPENPVSCILCPNEGGAFKQTIHGDWVHLLCAIWVPETRVANDVFMEPITGVEKISKQRWKLKCSVCEIREGACIQCAKTSCFLAFHATCARKEKLLMPMKSTHGAEPAPLTCFCEKHLPKEQYNARAAALAAEDQDEGTDESPKLSKSARAYAKTYKPGPPLVPFIIVERIVEYIKKVMVRKKSEFVLLMCKYWSLKREARRGAPLLKRLHLEPWTASTGSKQQTDEEKALKLEHLKRLRDDLQNVRSLAELSRKRESRKLKQAELIQEFLSHAIFPHEPPLRLAFERIMGLDRQDYFKNPVSKLEVPDYFDIVKHPMCWNTIDGKLDRHEYWDIQVFKSDIQLVLDNAVLYNKPGTPFYKAALRIQNSSQPILKDLDQLAYSSLFVNETEGPIVNGTSQLPPIGDLEPPLDVLNLLVSEDVIKDDIDLVLDKQPLTSLFSYEFGRFKPPPSPPPPPPPKPSKAERKAERERRRQEKKALVAVAAEGGDLDTSPGFRAPRTRRAVAAAAAFEAEAQGTADVEAQATPDVGPSEQKGTARKGRVKRAPITLPGQSDVPPVVEDIDKRDLFTMFDRGWILPDNAKRGGRSAVERPPVPSPKKRARTDQGPSRLSVFSTPLSDNQTLLLLESAENPSGQESAMDVDIPSEPAKPESSGVVPEVKTSGQGIAGTTELPGAPISNIVRTADGTIIVEELDTPAIRRQKNMRRKAERLRQEAADASASAASAAAQEIPQVPVAGPSLIPAMQNTEAESDLSSLSDLDSNEDEEPAPQPIGILAPPPPPVPTAPAPREVEPGTITLTEGQMLEGGTLIWAKADTYPWWPAVIYEENDPEPVIPNAVLKQASVVRQKYGGPIHLVRFYDKASSWQWLPLDKLKHLGDDKVLDQDLLSPNSRRQRFKTANIRSECRAAYRRAIAEMETDSGAEGEAGEKTKEGEAEGGDVDGNSARAGEVEEVDGHGGPSVTEGMMVSTEAV